MDSFFSFANTLVRRVFQSDPYSVIEVRIEDYVHYDIVAREDSLILHSYSNENAQLNFEIVLHRENQFKNAFSVYRSTNSEESHIYYIQLKDKLPVYVRNFPHLVTVSHLQEMCKYIKNNPTQNLAHICAYFNQIDYFRSLQLESPSSSSASAALPSPSSSSLASSPSNSELSSVLNYRDEHGKTPLHVAIEKERLAVIQAILPLSPQLDVVDEEGNNILHYAAQTNRDIIAALCNAISSQSTNLGTTSSVNDDNIAEQTEQSTSQLVRLINTKNRNNFSPLYLACVNDRPDCVKELLKYGADVNGASICEVNSPRRDDPIDLSNNKLISKLNEKDMKNGGTPLHWCKSAEVIEMLIDMNCNLNARNFHGDTALHIMITRVNLSCVLSLLSHGADVNAAGANGNTPLHLAIKANNVSIVQAVIVFGAKVDTPNSIGESARHMAATSTQSPAKDVILYILNSVHAKRCLIRRNNCNEGCALEYCYNGVPPERPASDKYFRPQKIYDSLLMKSVVSDAIEKDTSTPVEGKKRIKLLSLDGGGIRGLILIQVLSYLETILNKRIVDLFDWIAGTSTGGILALLLASNYSASECRQIYFRLKDKLFGRYMRPYCSETLERFLQQYLGEETKMQQLLRPNILVTATVADRFPPDIKIFRNYPGPNDILLDKRNMKYDSLPNQHSMQELVWKVARASGAAPTYFSQFDCFLDGGLISNNPTLDLLTEIQNLNRANEVENTKSELYDIDLVLSLGTGSITQRDFEKINLSIYGISTLASNVSALFKLLIEQASQAEGQVVERAQGWCSMIQVPYFRINPIIGEDLPLDESDNAKLVHMLWETMSYIYSNQTEIGQLITLLTR